MLDTAVTSGARVCVGCRDQSDLDCIIMTMPLSIFSLNNILFRNYIA